MIEYFETLNSCSSACAHKTPVYFVHTTLSHHKDKGAKSEEHVVSYNFITL